MEEGAIKRLLTSLEREGISAINFEEGVYIDKGNNIRNLEDLNIDINIERRDGAIPTIIKKVENKWVAIIGNEEIEINDNNFIIKSPHIESASIKKVRKNRSIKAIKEWIKVGDMVEGGFIIIIIIIMYLVINKIGNNSMIDSSSLWYSIGAVFLSAGVRIIAKKI